MWYGINGATLGRAVNRTGRLVGLDLSSMRIAPTLTSQLARIARIAERTMNDDCRGL